MLMDSNSHMALLFTLFICFPRSDINIIAFIRETKHLQPGRSDCNVVQAFKEEDKEWEKKKKMEKHPCDPAAFHKGTAFQTSCLEDF